MLALKYRPQNLSEISGQPVTRAVLSRMLERNTVPNALLFSGLSGTGKTSAARILAAALNCGLERAPGASGSPSLPPCGLCQPCQAVRAGTSLSVLEIDGASNGSVDHIRELREALAYEQIGRRVTIIDEAQSLSGAAFNALLKILEEGSQVTFILVTTEPHKIPKTVRARVMEFEFGRISAYEIAKRLEYICQQEEIEIPNELIAQIARDSQGKSRDAVMRLDLCSRAAIDNLTQYSFLFGNANYAPHLIEAMLSGNVATVFLLYQDALTHSEHTRILDALAITLRETMTVRAASAQSNAVLDPVALGLSTPLDTLTPLASRIDAATLFRALRLMWDLRTRVASSVASTELALVMMTEALSGLTTKEVQRIAEREKALTPLSMSEMERM